jgi:hypothetical protein
MGQLNSRARRPAGPVSFTQSARTRRHAIRAFRLRNNRAILHYEDDYKDQIHYETARQSRSALGIGLINSLDF